VSDSDFTREPYACEQDKLIASVELAGYRLERVETHSNVPRYIVHAPQGIILGSKSTRYSAAMLAETHIYGARSTEIE
jgi:hypothetical protein